MLEKPEDQSHTPSNLKEMLEGFPPGTKAILANSVTESFHLGSRLIVPELKLDCSNPACDGERFYSYTEEYAPGMVSTPGDAFLPYLCRNCQESKKVFAIRYVEADEAGSVEVVKIGEWPPYGPRLPSKLVSLIREDKDRFIKGRRAENQGLGIGAFAYYRRVVENQKNALLDEIIKVAEQTGAELALVEALNEAKKERQFSKAVQGITKALPQSLLVKGHNPLLLLHNALSQGLHSESDEECLKLARDIRVVLTDLSEKLASALAENKEIENAVKRLAAKKASS